MVSMFQTRLLIPFVLLCIIFSNQQFQTEAANILFFIGFGGPSHLIAMRPLIDALSKGNHTVTVLSQGALEDNSSKIQYYSPRRLTKHFSERFQRNFYDNRISRNNFVENFSIQFFGVQVCEQLYSDREFLEWLSANKFDLVIIDALFNECGYGIADVHKAKTILFSTLTVLPWIIDGIGIPDETSYIPDTYFGFSPDMSFLDRVTTAIMPVVWKLFRYAYYFPKLTSITKEGLGLEDFPSFSELEQRNSLVFINIHASQEYPRSLPANVIPVGGISWVEKKKPLPKEFEEFINQGKEGFVYISFGSFINFLSFPEQVQQRFITTLKRFPNIQFIWKLNEIPKNLPSNIMIEKWMPQQDLLRHPDIKAFITHSGIGGIGEAICTSVPLIMFPLSSEQDYNAYLVEHKGCGIKMEITQLTENGLEQAIKEILTNDSYKTNMRKVSSQFLDRPMKPLESAVWWTEYVLRQDTNFLQPSNVNQYWWVKRQLDVWFVVLVSVVTFNTAGLYLFYKLVKKCCSAKTKKATKLKQKQN